MSGYAFRSGGNVGAHDELYARALVFANGRTVAAIVATDLIGLDFDLVERIRSGVEARTGIPREAILLNSTHTHGGPTTRTYNAMGPRDEAYVDVMARTVVGAVSQAWDRMQPASVAFGRAPAQIGVNRRQSVDGSLRIGVNYGGPVDATVRALVVRNSRGEPFAVAFSHACHGTTLGGDNRLTTADWCGSACEALRRETAGAVTPLFLQGCCGNINPHPRGSFEHARAHGETVALAVLEACDQAQPVRMCDPEDVDFEEKTIDLPQIPPGSRSECEARLADAHTELESARSGGDAGRILHAEGMVRYAELALSLCEADPATLRAPFTLQRLTIGGAHLIGMPAEMLVQYGLDFERQSPSPAMALGYTNGVHNYVPTAADYALGGYEVEAAHVYYNTLMFTDACEKRIRSAVYELLGLERPDWTPYRA